MIRINLLPEEYRKKARTPVKLVLALTAAVLINSGLATWWAWAAFGVQSEIESEAATLQLEMDGLTPQLNFYHSLETEAKAYKSREETLASVTASRISWTRKLDELVDVVNRGGDGDRHLIWFDDLQLTQSPDPKAKTAGTLRANGHSGSDSVGQVANFMDDVESSAFALDFASPGPPEGTQKLVDEALVPAVAWAFPLVLTIKNAADRVSKPEVDKSAKGGKTGKPAPKNPGAPNAQPPKPGESNPATTPASQPAGTPAKDGGQ
jgi:Tfp pilus assembly protein PilN